MILVCDEAPNPGAATRSQVHRGKNISALNTLSIAIKLRVAFAIMPGLFAMQALLARFSMSVVQEDSHTTSANSLPGVRHARAINAEILDVRIGLRHAMADAQASLKKDSEQFAKLVSSAKERAPFDKFTAVVRRSPGSIKPSSRTPLWWKKVPLPARA